MPQTVEELQAEIARRDEQIRATTAKLQAHERIVRELGDAVERDAYGNPVGILKEPAPSATPTGMSGHPFAAFQSLAPEGWDPKQVDAYFNQLLAQQGFLTTTQWQQREAILQQGSQRYTTDSLKLYDHIRRAEAQYPWLGKSEDPNYKKTVEVLRAQGYAAPVGEPKGWLDYSWNDIEGLGKAARIAQAEMVLAEKSEAESKAKAEAAQQAGNLTETPAASGTGSTPTPPDFSKMEKTEDILAALDQAIPATPLPGAR